MRVMVLAEPKRLELTDMPDPAPGPGEVVVRIKACGICGSDVHGFDNRSGRRIPPLVMGHESAGVVAAVGKGVTDVKEGDPVTLESVIPCTTCEACRRGDTNQCPNLEILGVSTERFRRHGAYAEYVALPRALVHSVPEAMPLEQAAMVEPVSVAVHAVKRTPLQPDDLVVVVGTGMIGLLVVQALKAKGCGHLIAVDLDARKRALAIELGADAALDPAVCDVPAEVFQRTGGRGADVAMEVVGIAKTTETALACARTGGVVTLVGNLEPRMDLPIQNIVTRELTVFGTLGCAGEYPECIELMSSGKINVAPLISKVAPIKEGPALFNRLYAGDSDLLKVILIP